jgi:hypothetical protein
MDDPFDHRYGRQSRLIRAQMHKKCSIIFSKPIVHHDACVRMREFSIDRSKMGDGSTLTHHPQSAIALTILPVVVCIASSRDLVVVSSI